MSWQKVIIDRETIERANQEETATTYKCIVARALQKHFNYDFIACGYSGFQYNGKPWQLRRAENIIRQYDKAKSGPTPKQVNILPTFVEIKESDLC